MIQNYIYSILLGVFMKIYDDFTDLKIESYPLILDISKIVVVITTYLLINECYILSFIIMGSLCISNYCKGFDDTFWMAYTYFVGFLCIAYCSKMEGLIGTIEPIKVLVMFFVPFCIYIEETTFTEEASRNKLMSRFYGILINSAMILFLEYFDFVKTYGLEFYVYLIIFVNSYFLTNIIIQICYSKNIKNIDNAQEVHSKENTQNK